MIVLNQITKFHVPAPEHDTVHDVMVNRCIQFLEVQEGIFLVATKDFGALESELDKEFGIGVFSEPLKTV